MRTPARVAIVGAGVSGAACAAELTKSGDVYERGRAPGGRMAAPALHGRRVDLGAAYFTVHDADFATQVEMWRRAGLVREWTDTFDSFADGAREAKPGPMRYAARDGLRSLVRDLLSAETRLGAEVHAIDELEHDAVVLAMPDPQAARLAGDAVDWVDYEPVICVAAGWEERRWDLTDAAFVNGDGDVAFLADDGARRGDGAPVLVVHTGADLARANLEAPDAVISPALDATRRLLDIDADPSWTHAHRWTFAKPAGTHGDEPFALLDKPGNLLGICGDSWCPSGAPRVESAWLSGRRLGHALAERLSTS